MTGFRWLASILKFDRVRGSVASELRNQRDTSKVWFASVIQIEKSLSAKNGEFLDHHASGNIYGMVSSDGVPVAKRSKSARFPLNTLRSTSPVTPGRRPRL